jgi:hypothetical protein
VEQSDAELSRPAGKEQVHGLSQPLGRLCCNSAAECAGRGGYSKLRLRIRDHRLSLIRIAAFGSRRVHGGYDVVISLTALDGTVCVTGHRIQG